MLGLQDDGGDVGRGVSCLYSADLHCYHNVAAASPSKLCLISLSSIDYYYYYDFYLHHRVFIFSNYQCSVLLLLRSIFVVLFVLLLLQFHYHHHYYYYNYHNNYCVFPPTLSSLFLLLIPTHYYYCLHSDLAYYNSVVLDLSSVRITLSGEAHIASSSNRKQIFGLWFYRLPDDSYGLVRYLLFLNIIGSILCTLRVLYPHYKHCLAGPCSLPSLLSRVRRAVAQYPTKEPYFLRFNSSTFHYSSFLNSFLSQINVILMLNLLL